MNYMTFFLKKLSTTLLFIVLFQSISYAQMWNGQDTLYGNEWIDYSKTYFRIAIAEDGLFRITKNGLESNGFPVNTVEASNFRLWHNGEEEAIFTSTNGIFSNSDFIEFYGKKNIDEVDRFLFDDPDTELGNPWISMYNDTAAYFLTWVDDNSTGARVSQLQNDLTNTPPKEEFCWFNSNRFGSARSFKVFISQFVNNSWFDGDGLGYGNSYSRNLTVQGRKAYSNGPAARLEVRYFADVFNHSIKTTFQDTTYTTNNFSNSKIVIQNFEYPASKLVNNMSVSVEELDLTNLPFRAIGAEIWYPRLFDFENREAATFRFESANTPKYFEATRLSTSLDKVILWDEDNNARMEGIIDGTLIKFNIPALSNENSILISNEATAIDTISSMTSVTFEDFSNLDASYLILTSEVLNVDGAADEYAAYRSSTSGGSYSTSVVNVESLYEQFGYGVHFHPISIRNFLHYFKKNAPSAEHVLIIGKGLENDAFRDPADQTALKDSLWFVPSIGNPGSDWVYVLPNRIEKPIMTIGRVAATSPSNIRNYLDKVKEHDLVGTLPHDKEGKLWMKRFLHLSGGTSSFEQQALRFFLTGMEGVIENNRVGADVLSFYKTSNDPIQQSGAEKIQELVNEGSSFMSIFGHGAVNTLDFDFGRANDFNNKGRYPVIMGMGCFSGNCHTVTTSVGEEYVFAKDRGAIAFLATSSPGFPNSLNDYGRTFYEVLGSQDYYGKTLGECVVETINLLKDSSNQTVTTLIHQMVYQGDPAIRLPGQYGADFTIDNETVKIAPNPASLELDSVKIEFDILNLGEHTSQMLDVLIQQEYPNDSLYVLDTIQIVAPPYASHFQYDIPKPSLDAIGVNRIFVTLDPNDKLDELPSMVAEGNNVLEDAVGTIGQEVFYFGDDVAPIMPEDFAITLDNSPTLYASTFSQKADDKRFLFELDTTVEFNSPFKKDTVIVKKGGLLSWTPALNLEDSTVCYWRVATDSIGSSVTPWRTASFIYLENSPLGWNQSHFYQYDANDFNNIQLNEATRSLEYVDNAAFAYLWVGYYTQPNRIGHDNNWDEGYTGTFAWGQRGINQGLMLFIANPVSGLYVENPPLAPHNFDLDTTRTNVYFYFDVRDSLERIALMEFMENEIPDGHVVSALTFVKAGDLTALNAENWAMDSVTYGKNLFQAFESYGATRVRELEGLGSAPWGFIFHKNNPTYDPLETIVTQTDTIEEIRTNYLAKWTQGTLTTPVIGPARSWQSVQWKLEPFDDPTESATLQVLAPRPGQTDSIVSTTNSSVSSIDISNLNADKYPFLKLRLQTQDTTTRTVAQIDYLRVLYDGLPEGSVNLDKAYTFESDTLNKGERMFSQFTFENISALTMDSVLVEFRIKDGQNNSTVVSKRYNSIAPGDTIQPFVQYNTTNSAGQHTLTAEVNPNMDQLELYHFNNFLFEEFNVNSDNRNPLLDVTFDGQRIMNGDLVSPIPTILISLEDDNPFDAIQDTATFTVTIIDPNENSKKYTVSDANTIFTPATLPDNKATFEIKEQFTIDGTYKLVVNGKDAVGNASSGQDYEITFQVVTTSSLSNFVNYPNPFSTNTCFFYTLTGSEPPTDFKMQIMTVSGRIVREISTAEFGLLLPGTHQSQFCWDGKDEFGDQLANGVYLYKIYAKKSNGEDFELFENEKTSSYFKHGIGKMVLMR